MELILAMAVLAALVIIYMYYTQNSSQMECFKIIKKADKTADFFQQQYSTQISPLLRCFLERYSGDSQLQQRYILNQNADLKTNQQLVSQFIQDVLKFTGKVKYSQQKVEGSVKFNPNSTIELCEYNSKIDIKTNTQDRYYMFVKELTRFGLQFDKRAPKPNSDKFMSYFRLLLYILCDYRCSVDQHNHAPNIQFCDQDMKKNPLKSCGGAVLVNPLKITKYLKF